MLATLFGSFIEICLPSQTKILEGGTTDEMRMFEALFKVLSTQFGLGIVKLNQKSAFHLLFIRHHRAIMIPPRCDKSASNMRFD